MQCHELLLKNVFRRRDSQLAQAAGSYARLQVYLLFCVVCDRDNMYIVYCSRSHELFQCLFATRETIYSMRANHDLERQSV